MLIQVNKRTQWVNNLPCQRVQKMTARKMFPVGGYGESSRQARVFFARPTLTAKGTASHVPGYSLFRIEVIGAAHQHVVIDAAGEKIPWCACADRPAEILKTDKAGHIDELVRKQLVIAVLPDQDIAIASPGEDVAAAQGGQPIAQRPAVHLIIVPAPIEQIAANAGAFAILNHVAQIVVPDLHARLHQIGIQWLEIADDVTERGRRSGRDGGEFAKRDSILARRVVLDCEKVVDDQVRAGLQKSQRTSLGWVRLISAQLTPFVFYTMTLTITHLGSID
jgi:hypothetical protein